MQRRPREQFKWGKEAEKLLKLLKSRQIRAINKKCRALIDDFAAFDVLGDAGRPRYIPFDEDGYGFVLEWDYSDEIWVLNLSSAPKRKKRRLSGESGNGASGRRLRALPERAKRPGKKYMKRNLLVLYKKLKRSRFGQKLSAFVSDSGVMRDLSGIGALLVAEALRPFAASLEPVAVKCVCVEQRWYESAPRLVLPTCASAAQVSARGTFGVRHIESEQFRI